MGCCISRRQKTSNTRELGRAGSSSAMGRVHGEGGPRRTNSTLIVSQTIQKPWNVGHAGNPPLNARLMSSGTLPFPGDTSSRMSSEWVSELETPNGTHQPTPADVLSVKRLLGSLPLPLSNRLPLPLIDKILDYAGYWPCVLYTLDSRYVASGGQEGGEDKMILRTLPLGWYGLSGQVDLRRGLHLEGISGYSGTRYPCRKIEFELESHDQGWGGEPDHEDGPYAASYTWFDVGVDTACWQHTFQPVTESNSLFWPASFFTERETSISVTEEPPIVFLPRNPDHPFLPTPDTLQKNRCADKETQNYTITWHYLDDVREGSAEAATAVRNGRGMRSLDGSFVRGLKTGECVTLWMRARFPNWKNVLQRATVRIYWAV